MHGCVAVPTAGDGCLHAHGVRNGPAQLECMPKRSHRLFGLKFHDRDFVQARGFSIIGAMGRLSASAASVLKSTGFLPGVFEREASLPSSLRVQRSIAEQIGAERELRGFVIEHVRRIIMDRAALVRRLEAIAPL
jgi:hypothetical protein